MCPCVACIVRISSVQVCWIVGTVYSLTLPHRDHVPVVVWHQLTKMFRARVHILYMYVACTLQHWIAQYHMYMNIACIVHVLCACAQSEMWLQEWRCAEQKIYVIQYLTELTFELCCVGMWLVTCTLLSIAYTLSCVTKLSRTKRVLYIYISLSSRDKRILLVFCLV